MNRRIYGPYYSPVSDNGGGGGDENLSEDAQDLADLADVGEENDDAGDEDPDDDAEKQDGDPDDSEGDGDSDGEDEEEEGDEDDKEKEDDDEEEVDEDGKKKKKDDDEEEPELDAQGRPTVKAIKAALGKDVFKKFPYLKTAFFEIGKYKEVFADVQDAQNAASKAADYDVLDASIVGRGDPKILLQALHENNPKSLTKLAENFGPALRELDQDTYLKLTQPIIEDLLYFMTKVGEKKGEKNLVYAARHAANFVFSNGGEIPDITKRGKSGPSEEETQLQRDREAFDTTRHRDALTDIAGRASAALDRVIDHKLDKLTAFEKKAVIKDTQAAVNNALNADTAFQSKIKNLWAQAKRDSYSAASKKRIEDAWLLRAREVAPGIRAKLRQEALSARTPGKGDSNKNNGKKRSFPTSGGQSTRGDGRRVLDPSKIDYRKTTDADILSDDPKRVTYRNR